MGTIQPRTWDAVIVASQLRDALANLAGAAPVRADLPAAKNGQPVEHVHAVNLPHELLRQRRLCLEGAQARLQLCHGGLANQRGGHPRPLAAPAQAHVRQRQAVPLRQRRVLVHRLQRGAGAVAVKGAPPAGVVHPPAWAAQRLPARRGQGYIASGPQPWHASGWELRWVIGCGGGGLRGVHCAPLVRVIGRRRDLEILAR
mmetsp:Transcript_29181/g.74863  ORF Transcript_29181/g.74863 Transcript_29181/m.74863 type:complete len:201 (+) Transcript_29181:161-763(+)